MIEFAISDSIVKEHLSKDSSLRLWMPCATENLSENSKLSFYKTRNIGVAYAGGQIEQCVVLDGPGSSKNWQRLVVVYAGDATGTNLPFRFIRSDGLRQSDAVTPKITRYDSALSLLYRKSCHVDQLQSAIEFLFDFIENAFAEDDLDTLNSMFAEAKVYRLHERVLVGALRSTYRARHDLSNWWIFLEQTSDALKRRGLNESRLLRGLRRNDSSQQA